VCSNDPSSLSYNQQFNQYQQNKQLLNKMKTTTYINGYPDPDLGHGVKAFYLFMPTQYLSSCMWYTC